MSVSERTRGNEGSRQEERPQMEQLDRRVIHLVDRYLRTGMMRNGVEERRTKGTPQGSPLSPLLSNIVLDELDKELEDRGLGFVRYADDFQIYGDEVHQQAARLESE